MDQILIPLTTIVFMIEPTSGRWFHKLNTGQQSRLITKYHLPSSLDSSVCSDAKRANLLRLKSVCPKTKNKNKVSINHIVCCTVFKKVENINTTTTTTIIILVIAMMIINTL